MNVNPELLLREGLNEIEKPDRDLFKCERIFNTLYSYYNLQHLQPEVIYSLAVVHMIKENYGLSVMLHKEAMEHPEVDQKLKASCANNIGICDRERSFVVDDPQIMKSAIEWFKKAYDINNKDLGALANKGCCYVGQGTPEKAIETLSKCFDVYEEIKEELKKRELEKEKELNEKIRLEKDENKKKKLEKQLLSHKDQYKGTCESIEKNFNNAKWNLGLAYLELNDFQNGWKYYEYGKRTEKRNTRNYNDTPEWDGENGKTIVVYGEQGIGDELMWASMLPDLMKNNNVIFDCHPRLQHLFMQSFPKATVYGTRKERQIFWTNRHKIDARISLGSLGQYLRRDIKDFPKEPYLKADPELSQKYKEKLNALSSKKKIGISWRGGTTSTGELFRKIDLEELKPILELEDYEFISLQYREDAEQDLEEFHKNNPDLKIHHWRDTLDDYDETAGLVDNLDLIISVPQSVIHLAGAMGKKTIQLCPIRAMWQMGKYGEDMPWYDCVKSIWQTDQHNWKDVIEKAKDELCKQ